jgi:hypothetical protein
MSTRDKRLPANASTVNVEVHLEDGHKIDFADSVKKSHSEEHNANLAIQYKQLILAIVTTLLLFLTAWFTYSQSRSSQQSAYAATKAADIAKQTLDQANRSWLEPQLVDSDPWKAFQHMTELNQILLSVRLVTIGSTPVTDVHIRNRVDVMARDKASGLSYLAPGSQNSRTNIIYPGRDITLIANWYGASEFTTNGPAQVNPELANQIRMGQKYLVVYGEGTFTDPLGNHWFRFCFPVMPTDQKLLQAVVNDGNCHNYNSVGDGDPPVQ